MQTCPPIVLAHGDGWLVLDKPAGPSTHSDPEGRDMMAWLSAFHPELEAVAAHRLDAATSGCLLVATNPDAARHLAQAFARRAVRKSYLALVLGCPLVPTGEIFTHLAESAPGSGHMVVVEPGAGPAALTLYRVLVARDGRALVEAEPITGRTHQLRVHLRYLGHPILGDPLYGRPGAESAPRLMLHAQQIGFPAPGGGDIVVRSPAPPEFREWLGGVRLLED